jgi:hypothetical protein
MISISIFGTPVKAKAIVLVDLAAVCAGVTWWGLHQHPRRRLPQGLLIGSAATLLLSAADLGHPIGHIVSARYAGAPMDHILISEGMPRTLYREETVSPDVHRLRALGGPLFNTLGLLLSGAAYRLSPGKSIGRELAAWSALGHAFILIASLAPLPIVDGGTLLKWTLVARGKAETEAEELIRRLNWGMGIAGGILGLGLIALRKRAAGVISMGLSLVVIGVAAGRIR